MQAHIKLLRDEKRGPAYRPFVKVGREVKEEHVTVDEKVGSPCVACGESWPCKAFNSIFAMD